MSRRNCNFCTLDMLKSRLKSDEKFELRPKPLDQFTNGVDVIVVEAGGKERFAAWFAELSEKCEC